MKQANSGVTADPGISDLPATADLKIMLAKFLEGAKKHILSNLQESIDQNYRGFEYVESETEGAQAQENPEANTNTAVATKINNFIQPKPQISEKGTVVIPLNHLLRSSVLNRKQLQQLTQFGRTCEEFALGKRQDKASRCAKQVP